MKIEQVKEFKPVTITLETQEEYDYFFNIVEEALDKKIKVFVRNKANIEMAVRLSNFSLNNT